MACSDGGPDWCQAQQDKLDKVTNLLCTLCGRLDAATINADLDLAIWYREHQVEDAARLKREAQAKEERRKAIEAQIRRLQNELKGT